MIANIEITGSDLREREAPTAPHMENSYRRIAR
jgi:hypothetical protein